MNRDAEIFAEAIELTGNERTSFLDHACSGDPAVRERVERLIAGYEAAGIFLERSAAERPTAPSEEKTGDRIGRYSIVRKIGEGGCGVVYLADQHEPVRRPVALKVIKLGMDTREVIARFEAERQALALMDHPDIARVFDAGATDAGRPFFVMEYVDGVPITRFCDEHSLPMASRLELFARVCVALQHAHQKGIIHRDLKPSNILVALRDGAPAPKVIDFGIAKATQGRLTEQTLITAVDHFIGTPAYMSPEQAERRDLDIDTRSDIYSLGVLLYELLTGRPPYDPQSLVRAGIDEIRRIIREVDPPRPSTRVSTLADLDRATIARLRQSAPTQLSSVLRGDLDWIVMRCLEKNRDRRYGTAHELADDVRRHLRQEPVTARPPHALYRAQKFIARNRLACASAAAIAAALIAGTVVSVRQAVRATRAETLALHQREQAEALLTFMLGDFRTELKKVGKLNLLDSVGAQAMSYFTALNPHGLTDIALARQAKALTQIGETRIDQARFAEADAAFATALTRATELTARHPRDADMLFERAQVEFWIGFIARRRGDFGQASAWLTRYRDSASELVGIDGNTYRARRELISGEHNLAVVEVDRGNLAAAQRSFLAERAALQQLLDANPNDIPVRDRLADAASWLGSIAELDGRYTDAIASFREMTSALKSLVAQEPAVARWEDRLAQSLAFGAYVLAISGQRGEADAQLAEASTLQDALAQSDPKNQRWQNVALSFRLQRMALRLAGGELNGIAPVLADCREKLEALVAAEPASRVFVGRLLTAWQLEARFRLAARLPDAAVAAERAIAIGDQLIREAKDERLVRFDWAQAQVLAGRIAKDAGNPAAARQHWQRVVDVLGTPAAASNDWHLLDPIAQALVLNEQPDLARSFIERLRRFGYRPVDPFTRSTLELPR